MQPNTEEIEGPSHSDIGIATEEVLNEEDLLEIQEEPEEPDFDAAGCSGWTEGPETPDAEALVVVAGVVIGNMTNRSESIRALVSMFGFLWKYLNMNESEVEEKAKFFVAQYAGDVSSELVQEIMHLKAIHTSNLGEKPLNPFSCSMR